MATAARAAVGGVATRALRAELLKRAARHPNRLVALAAIGLSCAPLSKSGHPKQAPSSNEPQGVVADAPEEPARAGTTSTIEASSVPGQPAPQEAEPAPPPQPEEPASQGSLEAPGRGLVRGVGDAADRELALGDAALGRNDSVQALTHYRAARKLLRRHPAPIVGIVRARFAETGLEYSFASAPKDPRIAELLHFLDLAIAMDSEFGPAHLQQGQLLLVRGKATQAEAALGRALALMPEGAEAHSALAVCRLAQGDVDGALRGFTRASELEPNSPARLQNLGTAKMMKGDVAGAVAAYQRAARLAPGSASAHSNLGTALLSAGDLENALIHLNRAHTLSPERATFMSNLCYAHLQAGDVKSAESWCERAQTADPKLGSAWINLALVRVEQGRLADAEAALRRALALNPRDPRALSNLSDLKELRRRQR